MKEKVIDALVKTGLNKENVENYVERPADESNGDFSFPCFVLAKKLHKNPMEIAQDISRKIKLSDEIEKVISVGGYVNFFLKKEALAEEILGRILKEKDKYGSLKIRERKIMIEFSQPNTHKAFHVGHIRGTSLGESLARIFEFCGDKVIRANYSGDTGMHIAKWLWCYTKFHSDEKLIEDESWFAEIYVDAVKRLVEKSEYKDEVDEINRKLDSREDKKLNSLWKETRKLSINSWDKIYQELNTKFDVHFFESDVEKMGKTLANELVEKGIAEISEEATIMNFKKSGLGVWVLLRRDGTVLYSAKDLALAEKKFNEFDIDESLIITDSSQDLHFRQLEKTLQLMRFKYADAYRHASYGPIRFPWGKMSSRTGDNILYSSFKKEMCDLAGKEIRERFPELDDREVKNRALAIAISAIKYSMLKQDTGKMIVFDKNEALKFEGDSGPYLLYSYARAMSILKKAGKQKKQEISILEDPEKKLILKLEQFQEAVKEAYKNTAPATIAHYAFELAKTFSEFYHNCQVIGNEKESFRVDLVEAFCQVLKNSLWLLGINVIEEM